MQLETLPASAPKSALRLKQVLVPTDFSPLANKALKYALRFTEQSAARVTLIHVVETFPVIMDGISTDHPMANGQDGKLEKSFRSLVKSLGAATNAKVKWTWRRGLASHEIVEAARELDIDLIVIATHGYTGWKHFCIGSTAERVVRAAPCPVLVVRDKEHDFV